MATYEEKKQEIEQDIKNNKIMLYMKGNKIAPQCGFSAQVVHILNLHKANFETKDILADQDLRSAIKEFSDWPTIPQLYVNGEFIGGCDIITELHENGDLEDVLNQ